MIATEDSTSSFSDLSVDSYCSTDDEAEDLEEGESWIDWMRRKAVISEDQLRAAGTNDWITAQRRRQWTRHSTGGCAVVISSS